VKSPLRNALLFGGLTNTQGHGISDPRWMVIKANVSPSGITRLPSTPKMFLNRSATAGEAVEEGDKLRFRLMRLVKDKHLGGHLQIHGDLPLVI
jgi:hypothetical protein